MGYNASLLGFQQNLMPSYFSPSHLDKWVYFKFYFNCYIIYHLLGSISCKSTEGKDANINSPTPGIVRPENYNK